MVHIGSYLDYMGSFLVVSGSYMATIGSYMVQIGSYMVHIGADMVHIGSFYGKRTCSMAIAHILWPQHMFSGHSTCFLAIAHVVWPRTCSVVTDRPYSMAIEHKTISGKAEAFNKVRCGCVRHAMHHIVKTAHLQNSQFCLKVVFEGSPDVRNIFNTVWASIWLPKPFQKAISELVRATLGSHLDSKPG